MAYPCFSCAEVQVPSRGGLCQACRDNAPGYIRPKVKSVPAKPPGIGVFLRRQMRMLQTAQRDLELQMYDVDDRGRRTSKGYNPAIVSALVQLTPSIERIASETRKFQESNTAKVTAMSPEEKAEVAMEYLAGPGVSIPDKKRALEVIGASLTPKLREVK